MLSGINDFISREKLFAPGDRILLTVSGGMDSVAMAELFHRSGYAFGIAHCNFQLRGEEADGEEAFVRDLAANYGVEFHLERFQTQKYAEEKKLSIQMAARELRYDWFEKVRSEKGYGYIATAHHQDDQVETFLINLSRGTGLAGLHGILPKTAKIIRPMLFASREEIEGFIRREHIPFKEDSSNRETYYLRNRIRHIIIPELEKAFPGFTQNLQQTISNIRSAEQVYQTAIEEKASQLLITEGPQVRLAKAGLKGLQPLHTWLFELLRPYRFNADTCSRIAGALDKEPGRFFYSDTHQLLVDREDLIILPLTEAEKGEGSVFITGTQGRLSQPLKLEWQLLDEVPGNLFQEQGSAFLDMDTLEFPLEIRRWRQGDHFYPLGMKGRKKLSDYFVDEKLSRLEKESVWLLCSGGEVAWVIGRRIDERFKVTDATEKVLLMQRIE